MDLILFDGPERDDLLPLAFTRPVAEFRVGILTIREKWERRLDRKASWRTVDYLSAKYPEIHEGEALYVAGAACPNNDLVKAVLALRPGSKLVQGERILALCDTANKGLDDTDAFEPVPYTGEVTWILNLWDIFSRNGEELEKDFDLLTAGRTSAPVSSTNTILGNRFFAEEGAVAEASVFNSTTGAIYLAAHSEVMEGSLVRGGLALGEHAALKLGTKIYGPTTIGPYSKVGGEVNNSVLFGYSNKGHDGFLGNSVLGEWCNIGADSNNSNLKNNYEEVKLWNYRHGGFRKTGLQFCGLIMGDHSKCGINTMFNTGTVVGVSANIFGAGFPRNFIPSFSWGGPQGMTDYRLDKALETAERVFARRGKDLDAVERAILAEVYDQTVSYRG